MFAGDPHALLGIGDAAVIWRLVAQEVVFKLVHAGIGEHQGGVILAHDRRAGNDLMLLGGEKVEERLPYFS